MPKKTTSADDILSPLELTVSPKGRSKRTAQTGDGPKPTTTARKPRGKRGDGAKDKTENATADRAEVRNPATVAPPIENPVLPSSLSSTTDLDGPSQSNLGRANAKKSQSDEPKQIEGARKDLQEARAERDQLRESLSELQKQLGDLRQQVGEVADLSAVQSQLASARAERDELLYSITEAERRSAELRQEAGELAALGAVREELESVRAQRDEVVGSIGQAEARLAELHRQQEDVEKSATLDERLQTARSEIHSLSQQAHDAENRTRQLVDLLKTAGEHETALRATYEALRAGVADSETALSALRRKADETRGELESAWKQLGHAAAEAEEIAAKQRETRADFTALEIEAREAFERLEAAIEEAATLNAPTETPMLAVAEIGLETDAESPHGKSSREGASIEMAEIESIPEGEQASDTQERLVRLLSDAWSAEKELLDLFPELVNSTGDSELEALFDSHQAISVEQQRKLEERVQQLGGKLGQGRSPLSRLSTHLWDVLHTPRDVNDKALQALLQALSAAEFEAGLYSAIYALAKATGDEDTTDLAKDHFNQERKLAEELRAHLTRAAVRFARRQTDNGINGELCS